VHDVKVPVHAPVDHVQPDWPEQLVESASRVHGVTVPEHVPVDQLQPPVHVVDVVKVLHW
jgi:hypothetical protein